MAFELNDKNLRRLCKERNYYSSRLDLNEVLHLQHKGITKLQNLDEFTGLK
jgi:dynein assembly factor 1, axonemal